MNKNQNTTIGGVITVIIIVTITAIAFISRNTGPQIQPENAGTEKIPAQVATTSPNSETAVDISNFSYSPSTIKVKVGDTVTWTNRDIIDHTATASDGSFDTGLFSRNESKSVTFKKAGTYNYYCTPHPFMKGVVIVE